MTENMIRHIICKSCAEKRKPQYPEDVALGWRVRATHGSARKPATHEIRVITAGSTIAQSLPSLICDHCGEAIPDGTEALAVTQWRGKGEPPAWEGDYIVADFMPPKDGPFPCSPE